MITNRRPHCLVPLILVALLFGAIDLLGSNLEENRRIKNNCSIQNTRLERRRDGPVDYKIFLEVTNTITRAGITVECEHRAPGVPDWLIRIGTTNTNAFADERRLIAGALLHAVDVLQREYPADPIGAVYLNPATMPAEFSAAFYEAVAAQMKKLDSKAQRFNDPKVRQMVKKAYGQMDYVWYTKSRLEEAGFRVDVGTAELCCLKRSLEGKTWKEIADQPAAGLEPDAATCCMLLEPGRKPNVR